MSNLDWVEKYEKFVISGKIIKKIFFLVKISKEIVLEREKQRNNFVEWTTQRSLA